MRGVVGRGAMQRLREAQTYLHDVREQDDDSGMRDVIDK